MNRKLTHKDKDTTSRLQNERLVASQSPLFMMLFEQSPVLRFQSDGAEGGAEGSADKSDLPYIEAAQQGDVGAFSQLVDRYQKHVIHFIFRLTHSLEDSEDIAQEAFVKAFRALGRYDSRWSFKTWLFTIARNTAINVLKKKPQIFTLDSMPKGEEENNRSRDVVDETEGVFEQLAGKQFEAAVIKAMKLLPAKQAAIFHLKHFEQLKIVEISQAMGLSQSDVKVSLHRARNVLKEELKEWAS